MPPLETSLQKPYGFLNAYTGYFRHVATTENEVNELGADAETLSLLDRRVRRVRHEDSKWDPEYYMYTAPFFYPKKQWSLNQVSFEHTGQISQIVSR